MKNILKALSLMFLVLVLAPVVNAANPSPNYDIRQIKVDGIVVWEAGSLVAGLNQRLVERGDSINIDVLVQGQAAGTTKEVRVLAEIPGHEDDIEDESSIIKLEPTISRKVTLTVDVPTDIDANVDEDNNSAESFTLRIKVFDNQDFEFVEIPIKVGERRHDLDVQDVILRPSATVEADNTLFLEVRVENIGDNRERDIKVIASIPELKVTDSQFISRLETEDRDNEDERNSESVTLALPIPEDAETGDYNIEIEVEFNRGRSRITETETVHVKGTAPADVVESLINVDATSKKVAQAASVSYSVSVANFEKETTTYSAEVLGVGTFGSASVTPSLLRVLPEETGELLVTIAANSDAAPGEHTFTIKVKQNGKTVKELNVKADVQSVAAPAQGISVRRWFEIGFAALAVILVLLGIIIAFTRLKGNEEEPEERKPGETYY